MATENEAWRKKRAAEMKKEYEVTPWQSKTEPEPQASWDEVDSLLVAYVVVATTGAGASVQFTQSRDGGTLGVRVYDDSIKTKTEWERPDEGLSDLLYRIGDYYRLKSGREVQRWS